MHSELGVFLMEDTEHEGVAIQLYADTAKLKEMIANLTGKVGDKPARATVLYLKWQDGKVSVSGESKALPVELESDPDKVPDGLKLGVGPIFLPKDESKKV